MPCNFKLLLRKAGFCSGTKWREHEVYDYAMQLYMTS
jgi:hypothetical protein